MLDLQKFCVNDPELVVREDLAAPFSVGEYTYATDGKVLVRVPRREEITAAGPPIDTVVLPLADIASMSFHPLVIEEIHTGAPMPAVPCDVCEGVGRVVLCQACDGEGGCECGECGQYKECEECDSKGVFPAKDEEKEKSIECEECGGDGLYSEAEPPLVLNRIGASWFDLRLLAKIMELPNLEVAPHKVTAWSQAMVFRFEGGEGLIMPIRHDAKAKSEAA